MRLLILSVSRYSVGELHNAILFAHQLRESGWEVSFLTMPAAQAYAVGAGYEAIPWTPQQANNGRLLQQVVAAQQPAAVFVADYANLFLEPPVVDPEVINSLEVPVATFDSMGFTPEPTVLEIGLLRKSQKAQYVYGRGMGAVVQFPRLPEKVAVVRTCPIHKPFPEPGTFTVKLYPRLLTLPPERREAVRRRFGVQDGEKLILVSKASWAAKAVQVMAMEKGLHNRFAYESILKHLLEQYLQEVDAPVLVMGVGTRWPLAESVGKIRYQSLSFLGFAEYQELLLSADLFLSDNMTSSSLAKAMMGEVPAVALMNSVSLTESGEIRAPFALQEPAAAIIRRWESALPGTIFPFYVFPFGWVKELTPLWEGNPWTSALVVCEMFDVAGTARRLADLLEDPEHRAAVQAGHRRYWEQCAALPGALEAVEWVLHRSHQK